MDLIYYLDFGGFSHFGFPGTGSKIFQTHGSSGDDNFFGSQSGFPGFPGGMKFSFARRKQ